jgi:uncharacterized membrane protein YgcG
MTEITRKVTAYSSAISFIITVAVFFSVHLFAGVPLEIGLVIGVCCYVVLFSFSLIDVKYQWHRAVFGPIRKHLQFFLATIIVKEWNVKIDIDPAGGAAITHEISGKVNFGYNKWITFGFMADSPQLMDPNFPISAKCTRTGNPLRTEFMIDCPKYKRVKVNFESELERGEEFQIKVEYSLSNTFFFDREDFYVHHAFHNEKVINIEVSFPETVRIEDVRGDIVTEHGDSRGKQNKPLKKTDQFVTWRIDKGIHGDAHKVIWITTTRQLRGQQKSKT